ncbi:MAG: GatB/YqeY domain-containing protein [Cohaesibacteraceae bacterium]|nr:GatB/YqeY domain-containing protein [Cohaesibacteraceae bacterium]MBL4875984.1 GatB/YqeY domain-containing protein [Cohaesibacteraceae bacterium]PCH80818.1 MAG: glutamyl-tRNA amidotransferase [Hyphomicrobiales bacterium]
MREIIFEALKVAMKSRNKRRTSTLRLVQAAIKDRDIAARTRGTDPSSDEDILQILSKMIKQREDSSRIYEEAGRLELCEQEREEIEIIREFLPRQMSEDEVRDACSHACVEVGGSGLRDMGKAMAILKANYPGQMDFGRASVVVKGILAN